MHHHRLLLGAPGVSAAPFATSAQQYRGVFFLHSSAPKDPEDVQVMTGSIRKCLEREESILTDPLVQRLFRLFLLFADGARVEVPASEPGHTKTLGCITAAQAHFLVNEFFRQIRPHCLVSLQISLKSDRLTFRELVEFCDLVFPDRKQLEPVVDRVFDRYVSQIVGKGFLMCRSARSPHCFSHKPRRKYKSYWCTLMPGIIYLWPLHKPTTVRNRRSIVLGEHCELHNGPFEDDRFTWTVITPEKEYQFGHFDEIRRQHWIAEMNLTMKYRNKEDLLRSDLDHSKRKEHLGNSEKCIAWKIALEGENQRLTELLNEERKALFDEEVVRQLATRMLDEEREKSEKLQKELAKISEAFMVEREITEELQKCIRQRPTHHMATQYMSPSEEPPPSTSTSLEPYELLILSTQSI